MAQHSAQKRQAIVEGARRVFGHDGYARAGIDAIAREAGVSTRTIYNHFPDGKAELFRVVVEEGSELIVEEQVRAIDRRLHKVTDLEQDLQEFAVAWWEARERYPDHFAVVRQLRSEVGHVPQEFLDTWQRAGPERAMAAVAARFGELGDEGLLEIEDPGRAVGHYMLLALGEVNERTYQGALPMSARERDELIRAGVRVFLRAYAPR